MSTHLGRTNNLPKLAGKKFLCYIMVRVLEWPASYFLLYTWNNYKWLENQTVIFEQKLRIEYNFQYTCFSSLNFQLLHALKKRFYYQLDEYKFVYKRNKMLEYFSFILSEKASNMCFSLWSESVATVHLEINLSCKWSQIF